MGSYIVFFFMLIIMFFYTDVFGNETSMLMLYMLILSPILSLLVAFLSRRNLEVSIDAQVQSAQVEKDGIVRVSVFLRNKSFMPIPIVYITFIDPPNLSLLGDTRPIISLGPFKTQILVLEYKAKCRGVAAVGVKDIKVKDYLGFFGFSVLKKLSSNENIREVTVLNKIANLKANSAFLLTSAQAANDESGTASDNLNFLNCLNGEPGYEFREYQPGDPMHKVHWKLSSKTEVFIVRKDEGGSVPKKKLILDPFIYTGAKSLRQTTVEREDKILEALISVANMLIKAGRDVEVWLFENGGWMSHVLKDRENIVQLQYRLAAYKFMTPNDNMPGERLPITRITSQEGRGRIFSGGDAIVFTAYMNTQLSEMINGMQGLKIAVDLVVLNNVELGSKETSNTVNENLTALKMNMWTLDIEDEVSEVLV